MQHVHMVISPLQLSEQKKNKPLNSKTKYKSVVANKILKKEKCVSICLQCHHWTCHIEKT